MAASVSGFLGFALSKVVDQFWTRDVEDVAGCESMIELNEEPVKEVIAEVEVTKIVHAPVVKAKQSPRQQQNARRSNNRRKTAKVVTTVEEKAERASDVDAHECASNASTCASSDEEDEAEDLGEKEMRLMLERVQQIKRLAKQGRQARTTRAKAATKAKEAAPQHPDVRSPIRLQNVTNELWNWSVYSGFSSAKRVKETVPLSQVFSNLEDSDVVDFDDATLAMVADIIDN
ncbi:hypothetical protein Poli38472_000041 [Pythium oligandrum]|uniref:Uncharacterized protein n=1 Tax=Pythium oligandrum TaxID=41045 RepID=A0A8K1FGG8_PYTOL|nr:hypothetical protein Poli38472_000041 [Pythium oligandrum]|eukprot:TMW59999.1 hypothetical protein Poli38472_000041 [Pythium oligandrum]